MLFIAAVLAIIPCGAAVALEDCKLEPVKLEGEYTKLNDLKKRAELSGVAQYGKFLIVISNEVTGKKKNENSLQLFRQDGPNTFVWVRDEPVFKPKKKDTCIDADLEGIAVLGDLVYVVGSHSRTRPKIRKDATYKDNRDRLANATIDPTCDKRNSLLELRLNEDGSIASRNWIDLARSIKRHAILKPFAKVPSKENGIDIEGIAVTKDEIYVGFRGPVLRDNYAPVLVLNRQRPKAASELRYVDLEGRGIRDMAAVADGFLLIAGPVGDARLPFDLVHWDGKDMIPGSGNRPDGKKRDICRLPTPGGAKPEGVAVVAETSGTYTIIVVFDGDDALTAVTGSIPR